MPKKYFSCFSTGIIKLMESDIFYSEYSIRNNGKGREGEKQNFIWEESSFCGS